MASVATSSNNTTPSNKDKVATNKEHRFTAYFMGEEKLPENDVFSLEKAHSLMLNSRLPKKGAKGFLRKRKCHIKTHQQRGLHLTKAGFFSHVVSLWLDYSTVRRFYVFKMEPCTLILGVSSPDYNNRFYILRFKTAEVVNEFCDHFEQRKGALNNNSSVPQQVQASPSKVELPLTNHTSESLETIDNFEKEVMDKVAATSPFRLNEIDDDAEIIQKEEEEISFVKEGSYAAIDTSKDQEELEEEEEEEHEEDEMTALRCYDEILDNYDASGEPHVPPSPLEKGGKFFDAEPEYAKSLPYRKTRENRGRESIETSAHTFCSLGRPRQRSEIPALLFRKSQRHKILSEDVRFLNYGSNGYYETNDGPIFFYVAHMKSSTGESEDVVETNEGSPKPAKRKRGSNSRQSPSSWDKTNSHSETEDGENENKKPAFFDNSEEEEDEVTEQEKRGKHDDESIPIDRNGHKGSYSKNPAVGKYVNKNYTRR